MLAQGIDNMNDIRTERTSKRVDHITPVVRREHA